MGHRLLGDENIHLGKLQLPKLSPSARREAIIEVSVNIDDNGIIEMVAADLSDPENEVVGISFQNFFPRISSHLLILIVGGWVLACLCIQNISCGRSMIVQDIFSLISSYL